MPEILRFSREFTERVSQFFTSHPILELEETRPADETSALVNIVEMRCMKCGFVIEPAMAPSLMQARPSDMLRATKWRHAWDQASRSVYCGGTVMFVTVAASDA